MSTSLLNAFSNAAGDMIDWIERQPKAVSAACYAVGMPVAMGLVGAAAGAGFEAVGWGGEYAASINYVKACAISGAIGISPGAAACTMMALTK